MNPILPVPISTLHAMEVALTHMIAVIEPTTSTTRSSLVQNDLVPQTVANG